MALPRNRADQLPCVLLRAALLLVPLSGLPGCTKAARMANTLDASTLEERPQSTPPDDYFLWTTQPVDTSVVSRPGGGNWARVIPKPQFLADPSMRRQALLAYTEPLATSPPERLRGKTAIRLDGYGRVFVGLQSVNGASPGGFLGGMVIDVPTVESSGGTVHAAQGFNVERILDIYPLQSAGTIGAYQRGSVVEMQWTIDQAARALSVTMARSTQPAVVINYPAAGDGVSNSPLPKLMISVWLQHVGPNTAVFLDDFFVEEF